MNAHAPILKWATDCLISKGYSLQSSPEILLETPWSNVIRFSTSRNDVYLKQMPPAISLDPKIIQLLTDHCFLMKDAGQNLRAYLKTACQPDLLCQAIRGPAPILVKSYQMSGAITC